MGRAEGTGQQKVQFELEAEPTTVLYMPAAQRAHRLELFAPIALLYVPAAHACDTDTSRCRQVTRTNRTGGELLSTVHVAGELAPKALLYVPAPPS